MNPPNLQVELCYLQAWMKSTGARIIIVFEAATPPERAEPFGP